MFDFISENSADSEDIPFSFLRAKFKQVLTIVYGLPEQYFDSLVSDGAYFSSAFFNFDDFQLKILKVSLTILILHVVLIVILWNKYKAKIYERFIQPGNI